MAVTEPPAVPFGGLLRRLRIDAGLTQEELAEAARLSYRSISDLERGISLAPRKETIRLLADALNLAGAERTEFEAAARWRGRVGGFMAQAVPAGSVAAAQPLPAGGTQVNYWGKDSLGPEAGLSIAPPLGRTDEAVPLRGRASLLNELTQAWRVVKAPRVHVLHGLGGCGKTSIALEVARLATADGVEVWWLSAAGESRLLSGMHALARRLGVAETMVDRADAVDMIWRGLSERTQRWLLVVDNADDPRLLALGGQPLRDGTGWIRPVESTAGLVLVTSRDGRTASWGRWCRLHRVSMLTTAAAADVLIDHVYQAGSRNEAEQLGRRLGGLPLALRLAGCIPC